VLASALLQETEEQRITWLENEITRCQERGISESRAVLARFHVHLLGNIAEGLSYEIYGRFLLLYKKLPKKLYPEIDPSLN
jgi:hypothetical protein